MHCFENFKAVEMKIQKVFSLNFSSAGKGQFTASKAKNAPEAHFPGRGGEGKGVLE